MSQTKPSALQLASSMFFQVNAKKRKKEVTDSLRNVPLTFTDVNDYLSVFEPLLFEEVKAQICRGEEEGGVLLFQAP